MMQPCDDDDLPSFSDAVVADPLPSEVAPPTTSTTASKYQTSVQTASDERGGGDSGDSDEYHDSESDGAAASYTLVKKSVFKDPKRSGGGLLSRLKDAAPMRGSSARNKYIPTAALASGAAVVAPRVRRATTLDAAPQIVIAQSSSESSRSDAPLEQVPVFPASNEEDDDPYDTDGSRITVAIAESTSANAEPDDAEAQAAHLVEVGVAEDLPQVVIHSGESDSDSTRFATLNPVINASGGGSSSSKRYRFTTPLALSTPASTASAMVSASSVAAAPCLQEIPAMLSAEGAAEARDHRLTLVVNALGASGLAKVEKFGTQSTFLEIRLCSAEATSLGAEPPASSSVVRTALHKKGGSDAQWNQQFSMPLRSPDAQVLHIAVKTHGKTLVGEARVSLAQVLPGGLYYDQHYTIFRTAKLSDADSANDISSQDADAESGRVHLQLKIVDASSSASVPPLRLSLSALNSAGSHLQLPTADEAAALPPVLRNGALLFKVPYHSRSLGVSAIRRQWVMVAAASAGASYEITWCDPTASASDRKSASSLDLTLVTEVRDGHRTPAFERQLQTASSSSVVRDRDKCFSLVTKARTLDLVASCKEEARVWVSALRGLLFQRPGGDSLLSARVMEDYKAAALSPRPASQQLGKSHPPGRTPADSSGASKARLAAWRSVVFDLARRCRTQEIAECLHDGCPVDLLEPGDGDTMLMIACRLGHVQLVALCLSWRAKNDPHPEFGETALQTAVNASHSECLALLLTTAAKSEMDSEIVNHIDSSNDAPLHVAARHGDLACLQLLLHHGADICVVDEFGRTPLHCAVAHGHCECVAYLLDVGGDSVLNAGDHDGDTALHYAALAGTDAIVKLLLESAANVFSANAQDETPYDVALREKQQASAFLISQYYLTNTKEPPAGSSFPATRNEAASTLLLRQQEREQLLRGAEDEDEDDGEGDAANDDGERSESSRSDSGSALRGAFTERRDCESGHPYAHQPYDDVAESKYQSRTGFKLSIDVASPTRKDETCPVFVPSPRSRSSPSKKKSGANDCDPRDSPGFGVDESFQKSRPSSPRGKSANIQLIEPKRANNLAIALASFRIHDQYEQIVSDLVAMSEKTVSAELLACLQRFFPTEDERAQLQAFGGPTTRLGKAEQFFRLLLQVPRMQERIDMFLYKLEFARSHRSLLAKVEVVKRACRDLLENFSFLQVLQDFFDAHKPTRFKVFQDQRWVFQRDFLPRADEKLRSFRRDLEKAADVELLDVQIQFNRLVAGIRSIRAFVDSRQGAAPDERDLAAHSALQLFVAETRAAIAELESEYESMDAWADKLLGVFGESKATCQQLSTLLRCVAEVL
ncbi:hypothetical protein PybrP1_001671 [[Pythium] brassicae (nom. inval.)]|nr:hypothetical protein PybrP1_001671 [[Pythium] brassicae (nom. inval.)]